ncbi:hypothetical protein FOZ62_004558 [Perkinsus olseni]|uniref:Uncharacterized protein n=1 Tax=Perkinsus olseni TaxID=32597 RepID=A0A7J6TSA0_PEROL|nr:hypothetical protein FOZ62_004558 [Perkinsus olseni]
MKVAPSESKGVNSRISRVFGNVRNAASRFRRRGDDGLKDQLLAEDDKDILEDYDREKIDGSRESFPHAPLDTVEGEPSTIESPADSFGTETKTKAVRSGIGGGFGRLRNSLSRLRKYGKDGRKYGRLDEGNAEEFAAHGH